MNLDQDFVTPDGLVIEGGTYTPSFRRWAESQPPRPSPATSADSRPGQPKP